MSELVKEIEEVRKRVQYVAALLKERKNEFTCRPEIISSYAISLRACLPIIQRAREALSWYKPDEKQPEELVLPEDRAGHGFSDIVLIWYEGTRARSIGYYYPKTDLWYDSLTNRHCTPALWAYLLPNPDPPEYTPEAPE